MKKRILILNLHLNLHLQVGLSSYCLAHEHKSSCSRFDVSCLEHFPAYFSSICITGTAFPSSKPKGIALGVTLLTQRSDHSSNYLGNISHRPCSLTRLGQRILWRLKSEHQWHMNCSCNKDALIQTHMYYCPICTFVPCI